MKATKQKRSKLKRSRANHGVKPCLHKRPRRLRSGVKK